MAKTEILRNIDQAVKSVDARLNEINFIVQNVMKNPDYARLSEYGSKYLVACTQIDAHCDLINDSLKKWDEYTAAWEKPSSNKLKEAQRLAKKVLLADSRKKAKVLGEGLRQHNVANHEIVKRFKGTLAGVFG